MIEGRRTTGRETIDDSGWAKDFGRRAKDDGRRTVGNGLWSVGGERSRIGGGRRRTMRCGRWAIGGGGCPFPTTESDAPVELRAMLSLRIRRAA